eukprot:scaffold301_cov370-Pavlova_lutheri.AAC.9
MELAVILGMEWLCPSARQDGCHHFLWPSLTCHEVQDASVEHNRSGSIRVANVIVKSAPHGPDLTEHLDEQPDVGVDLLLASATARHFQIVQECAWRYPGVRIYLAIQWSLTTGVPINVIYCCREICRL